MPPPKKQVKAKVKLHIPGGQATPAELYARPASRWVGPRREHRPAPGVPDRTAGCAVPGAVEAVSRADAHFLRPGSFTCFRPAM